MQRHLDYTKLVKMVHDHMIQCYWAHHELIEEKKRVSRGLFPERKEEHRKIQYKDPGNLTRREGRSIETMLDINSFQTLLKRSPVIEQVQRFLRSIKLEPNSCKEDIGTSWIELYVMYKKSGLQLRSSRFQEQG